MYSHLIARAENLQVQIVTWEATAMESMVETVVVQPQPVVLTATKRTYL
jgi:hypothetical protein